MHKLVICLTKANSKEDAISNVESFIEPYGDGDVWDWYKIGGRWSGLLNPANKEFNKKAEELFNSAYPERPHTFITTNMVSEQQDALQKIWEELGQTSKNPYSRGTIITSTCDDDALPLSECIDVVREHTVDMNAEAEAIFAKLLEAREEEKESSGGTMSGYYAGIYKNLKYDDFSFESTVFDTDNVTNNPELALANPDGWYAVVVDLHN